MLGEDISDGHIGACVRFRDKDTLVTLPKEGFLYYCTSNDKDYDIVVNAQNVDGEEYNIVEIPLTENYMEEIEDYGCYLNYCVGNGVVLVPTYEDQNDEAAISIIKDLYPSREVVGINCRNLIQFGGMIHCVTQQQPQI